MRLVLIGVLLLAASTLFGCSSTSSVPSWAVKAAQSGYLREEHLAQHPREKKTHIARPIISNPKVDDPKVDGPKVNDAKVEEPKVDDVVGSTGVVPSKYKDYKLLSKEDDRRQKEENERVKAAITICRGC